MCREKLDQKTDLAAADKYEPMACGGMTADFISDAIGLQGSSIVSKQPDEPIEIDNDLLIEFGDLNELFSEPKQSETYKEKMAPPSKPKASEESGHIVKESKSERKQIRDKYQNHQKYDEKVQKKDS